MAALAQDFNAPSAHHERRGFHPVAASTTIYAGANVALNSAGYLVPADATTAGLRPIGRAAEQVDNSTGANGDKNCEVDIGIFGWNNSATNACTQAHVGHPVFVEDDNTVASVAGAAGTVAGVLERIEGGLCYVAAPVPGEANAGIETVTSGALSLTTRHSAISVTGTQAYTLANGLYEGQRKTILVTVAASTPDGTLTPATFANGTSIDLDAVNESAELEYHAATGWNLVSIVGATVTA